MVMWEDKKITILLFQIFLSCYIQGSNIRTYIGATFTKMYKTGEYCTWIKNMK